MTIQGMTRLEQIKAWQDWFSGLGIVTFPLFGITNGKCRCREGDGCAQPGKHPKVKGWRTLEDSVTPGPLDNLGVSTDHLVVVDVDSGDIPDDLPPTFTVSTGRGFHLWYYADQSHPIRNRAGWRPKIDIRAVGGLVAAPPSRHISGSEYTYLGGTIQPVPQFILDDHERHVERRRVDREAVTHVPDTTHEHMLPLVESLMAEMAGAPEGERNSTLFKIACRIFDLSRTGWVGGDALVMLVGAAVQAGLTHAEAARTIESAARA
jgi:hypothetical protein